MKTQNRTGPAVLGPRSPLPSARPRSWQHLLERDSAIFVDTRDHRQVQDGTVAGSLNIPAAKPAQLRSMGLRPGDRAPAAGAPRGRPRGGGANARSPPASRHRRRRRLHPLPRRARARAPEADCSRRSSTGSPTPAWSTSAAAPSTPRATSPDRRTSAAAARCGTSTSCPLTVRSSRTARAACAPASSRAPCAGPASTSSSSTAPTPRGTRSRPPPPRPPRTDRASTGRRDRETAGPPPCGVSRNKESTARTSGTATGKAWTPKDDKHTV